MPSHRHNLTRNNSSNYWNSRNNIGGWAGMQQYTYKSPGSQYGGNGGTAFYTDETGGGGGHSHGFTGSSHTHSGTLSAAAHTHNASFTGSAHNHSISVNNIDLAVQYLDEELKQRLNEIPCIYTEFEIRFTQSQTPENILRVGVVQPKEQVITTYHAKDKDLGV